MASFTDLTNSTVWQNALDDIQKEVDKLGIKETEYIAAVNKRIDKILTDLLQKRLQAWQQQKHL